MKNCRSGCLKKTEHMSLAQSHQLRNTKIASGLQSFQTPPSWSRRASTCSSDAHYVCYIGFQLDAHCRVLFMLCVSTHGRCWRSIKPFSSWATSARKNKAKAPETFAALSLAIGSTLFVVVQDRSLCHTTLLDMPACDCSENNSCDCTCIFAVLDCISIYCAHALYITGFQCVVRE